MAKTSKPRKVKFEEALAQLEKTVDELESGHLTLDESLARYEEGVKALKQCYEVLREAEQRVELLVKSEDGSVAAAPFEPEAEEKEDAK